MMKDQRFFKIAKLPFWKKADLGIHRYCVTAFDDNVAVFLGDEGSGPLGCKLGYVINNDSEISLKPVFIKDFSDLYDWDSLPVRWRGDWIIRNEENELWVAFRKKSEGDIIYHFEGWKNIDFKNNVFEELGSFDMKLETEIDPKKVEEIINEWKYTLRMELK